MRYFNHSLFPFAWLFQHASSNNETELQELLTPQWMRRRFSQRSCASARRNPAVLALGSYFVQATDGQT